MPPAANVEHELGERVARLEQSRENGEATIEATFRRLGDIDRKLLLVIDRQTVHLTAHRVMRWVGGVAVSIILIALAILKICL